MKKLKIKKKIIEMIEEQLNIKKEKIKTNLNLQDLGGDSLDDIELIMNIEDEFKIKIPENIFEKIKNINFIIKYLNKNLNKN